MALMISATKYGFVTNNLVDYFLLKINFLTFAEINNKKAHKVHFEATVI